MAQLRDKTAVRRLTPTKNPTKDWTVHKPDLKEDFHGHCAYCFSLDEYRHTFFEVDHFIPKTFFEPLGNITVTDYRNLVYACKFCNNKKLAIWPSKSETVYHNGKEGFIDPCTDEIENHLYRTDDGGIMWKTELGKWIFNTLNFDERQDVIKVIWNLKRLGELIKQLTKVMIKYPETSKDYQELRLKIGQYMTEYFWRHQELIGFYQ